MRVLLTGGAGFISSHVAEHLLERGHEVTIVDDLSTGKRENIPEGAVFYEANVRSGCGEVFEDFGAEALSHQAAQMDVRRSVKEPYFDAEVNALGTIRLLYCLGNLRPCVGKGRGCGCSSSRRRRRGPGGPARTGASRLSWS